MPALIEQISEKSADDLVGEELTAKKNETKVQKQRQKHDQAHWTVCKPRGNQVHKDI